MLNKPTGRGELPPFFKDRADKNFSIVSREDTLGSLPDCQFTVCCENSEPIKVFTAKHIAAFLQRKIEGSGELIIDLQSVTYENLIDSGVAQESLVVVADNESFTKASVLFKGKGVGFIVVKRGDDLIGVIEKAHRRY